MSATSLRGTLAALTGVAIVLTASAGSAAAPPKPTQPNAPASKAAPPAQPGAAVKSDRDGDKLFDDLEARLAALDRGQKIDVLVRLSERATAARVNELSRRSGGFAIGRRFGIVDAFAATVTKGEALALARMRSVVHVEENARVQATNDSAQSSFGVSKARADAPSLDGDGDGSSSTYSKADLVAAVIDTGVDAAHVELDGGKVIGFKDFINGRTAPYDDEGHGTHVAATIAGDGAYAGVAPAAAIVGVKVLDGSGNGTMEGVTAGIEWVVQNKDVYGIEAINLSLGAGGCADGTDTTSVAVNNAHAAGLVVVVAAGNEGPGTCTIGSPGAAANAITVGAISDVGERGFGLASFSSRGPTADGRVKPDVVAPGVQITSAQAGTGGGYVAYDGTSMATPFVAGVALLARDANATLTPQQVKDAIVGTAVDWARGGNNTSAGTTGADIDSGHGRLDAYAALKAAGAALGSGPAVPVHELAEGSLPGTGAYVDYELEVTETAFPIAATMIIPAISGAYAWKPDFDLYLFNPSGSLVARAETVYRQEQVTHLPSATGTYTLRVYSYSGSGGFFVDVSAPLGQPDTTAPAAPAGLSASAGEGKVALDWADNGESDLAGYAVYRQKADGSWVKLASVAASAYTDSAVTNGTTYSYRVSALDSSGNESAASAHVSATPTDVTAPAAPSGLSATAGDQKVALDWADNRESDLAGYTVYRQSADGTWGRVGSVTTSAYTDAGLGNGTTYTYRVSASDRTGNESTPSTHASATPAEPAATRTSYRPEGARILEGAHSGGSLASVYENDGGYLEISKKGSVNVADYYAYTTIATAQLSALQKLTIEFDGHASHSDVALTLSVYNWRAARWEIVDGPRGNVSTDRSFEWTTTTSPADYASTSGEVRFRVRGERSGGLKTHTDLIRFTVEA